MAMRDAILNFPKQFEYEPVIENADKFKPGKKFVVCGMGGSHLAADILKTVRPEIDITIHSDYGFPPMSKSELQRSLMILSSYSGNTEEPVDSFQRAHEQKLPMLAIATGGKLVELARASDVPYILLPNTGIQPRSALGISFLAMLLGMGEHDLLKEARVLAQKLSPEAQEHAGKALAEKLRGRMPVIYSSTRNLSLAYNWKIKLNETGKTPAFYNVLPELNHNEMTGFDEAPATRSLSEKFHFIFLKDPADDPRIQKRMQVLEKLYEDRGLPVEIVPLPGDGLQKVFGNLLLADWFALYTAENYGVESEQVPMVEEFKKLIK